jgi:cytochrome P450
VLEHNPISCPKLTPRQTQVWLSVYGLHHNPELWPNPDRFDPDRFYVKSEENTKRHPFAYMPFSMKSRAW